MKHTLWLLLSFTLFLTACRTTKNLEQHKTTINPRHTAVENYIKKVDAQTQTSPYLTSRLKMNLQVDGKNISCNGSLKMKQNDVILLSLSFLGFEVGRIQFTPDEVLIIDKINKQYVRGRYDEIDFLQQAHLDFYTLQALFWNQLFIPGQQNRLWTAKDYDLFDMSQAGDHTLLLLNKMPQLDFQFLTQTQTGFLDRVTIQSKNIHRKGNLTWKYADFTTVGNKTFPKNMTIAVQGLGKDLSVTFNLSSPNNNENWETRSNIKNNYTQRKIEDIIQQLMTMGL